MPHPRGTRIRGAGTHVDDHGVGRHSPAQFAGNRGDSARECFKRSARVTGKRDLGVVGQPPALVPGDLNDEYLNMIKMLVQGSADGRHEELAPNAPNR